jgi:hypothetical protein
VVNITREIFESARKKQTLLKLYFNGKEIIDTLNINYEARDSDKIAYF